VRQKVQSHMVSAQNMICVDIDLSVRKGGRAASKDAIFNVENANIVV
jgi:hypothetical protein